MQPIPHGWRLERQDIMYVRERLDFGYKKSQDFHLKKKKRKTCWARIRNMLLF